MTQKLNCIVLIDDDDATNFLNEMILKRMDCTEEIKVFEGGPPALDFLRNRSPQTESQPDLIFLDINMPGMNGWEFLEVYKTLPEEQRARIVLMMLTTSLNPDDRNRADEIEEIQDFLTKPLTPAKMEGIIARFFQ